MPGENTYDWSITAANNATADTSINWAEGQTRASVNNSARSMMAAHAKQRNLLNGSIITGGTANAQTFTSGITYTVVPTGLYARLKIGVTNTAAATLNMDGIGAVAIKDQSGNDISAGALLLGHYAGFLYNGTNWILIEGNETFAIAPQCGRLAYVSATALSFKPYAGDRIKINGAICAIPAAGIAGLANTSVYVGTVAGQNLAANTTYTVFAWSNAGVVTADFEASAPFHTPSTLAGNVGVEVAGSLGSEINGYTLIGMVRTNASSQFQDAAANRGVISWFNRRNIVLTGALISGSTTSGSFVELGTGGRANFLNWADEGLHAATMGSASNASTAVSAAAAVSLDAAAPAVATATFATAASATFYAPVGSSTDLLPAEGFHFITPFVATVAAVSGTFSVAVTGMIRG